MADSNTHIYFGLGVLESLPTPLKQKVTRDMDAFYLGLQGPDPLIFDPRVQKEARHFHKVWREQALPRLVRAMREGEPSESSFAAGGYLHLVLDDIVHPLIWRWMKEGSSHMRLELALDFDILREEGIKRMPRLFTEGKYRVAPYAHLMLPQAQANHYLTGLRTMQLTIDFIRHREKTIMAQLSPAEREQVTLLRLAIDNGILPTARQMESLLERGVE